MVGLRCWHTGTCPEAVHLVCPDPKAHPSLPPCALCPTPQVYLDYKEAGSLPDTAPLVLLLHGLGWLVGGWVDGWANGSAGGCSGPLVESALYPCCSAAAAACGVLPGPWCRAALRATWTLSEWAAPHPHQATTRATRVHVPLPSSHVLFSCPSSPPRPPGGTVGPTASTPRMSGPIHTPL